MLRVGGTYYANLSTHTAFNVGGKYRPATKTKHLVNMESSPVHTAYFPSPIVCRYPARSEDLIRTMLPAPRFPAPCRLPSKAYGCISRDPEDRHYMAACAWAWAWALVSDDQPLKKRRASACLDTAQARLSASMDSNGEKENGRARARARPGQLTSAREFLHCNFPMCSSFLLYCALCTALGGKKNNQKTSRALRLRHAMPKSGDPANPSDWGGKFAPGGLGRQDRGCKLDLR